MDYDFKDWTYNYHKTLYIVKYHKQAWHVCHDRLSVIEWLGRPNRDALCNYTVEYFKYSEEGNIVEQQILKPVSAGITLERVT